MRPPLVGGDRAADLVALDDAMNALARIDPRKVQVVEMRFFGGLSVEETAEVLKVSPVTVMRDWSTAKAWLYRELTGGTRDGRRTMETSRYACCSRRWSVRPTSATRFCGRRARATRRWSAKSARCWPQSSRREVSWRVRPSKWPRGPCARVTITTTLRERRCPHRPDHLPLPHRREAGRRRDGRGLQGRGHPAAPVRRSQVSRPTMSPGSGGAPTGSSARRAPLPR